MASAVSACRRAAASPRRPKRRESTGLPARDGQHVPDGAAVERPLSLAWITDAMVAETMAVWSEAWGRPVGEDEAMEILVNVRRLGEVLRRARREMKRG